MVKQVISSAANHYATGDLYNRKLIDYINNFLSIRGAFWRTRSAQQKRVLQLFNSLIKSKFINIGALVGTRFAQPSFVGLNGFAKIGVDAVAPSYFWRLIHFCRLQLQSPWRRVPYVGLRC